MSLVITKENFNQIRVEGIGSNFKVINPADGYRKDNRLWFGECATCGESVTNSSMSGKGWVHTLIENYEFVPGKFVNRHSDLLECPKA
jgi:hypothetical protein